MPESIQYLLSLPTASAACFPELTGLEAPTWFASSDPPGQPLGSGGGTVQLLLEAWRKLSPEGSFGEWLATSRKLLIHGGGLSRRVPPYAAVGKPLMPVPVWRWSLGQRIDQTLLDLQLETYRRVLMRASSRQRLLVASGDVIIRLGKGPLQIPDADIVCLGLWLTPEVARQFGVFFLKRDQPHALSFFLQKPSPDRIRELSRDHLFLADTGMWLFSEKAIAYLLAKTGWTGDETALNGFHPGNYGLYEELGRELGDTPDLAPGVATAGLTVAVLPLRDAAFHHFGTCRDVIRSSRELQHVEVDQRKIGLTGAIPHPDQYVLNSRFDLPLRKDENHTLWIENSAIPASWRIANNHVLTGVPENTWALELRPGVCLDFVPIGDEESRFALRFYGIDDAFRGRADDDATLLMGEPVAAWYARRGLPAPPPEADLHDLPLFPELDVSAIPPAYLQWLIDAAPAPDPGATEWWQGSARHSAAHLLIAANVRRLRARQRRNLTAILPVLSRNYRTSVFYKLDLDATATLYAATEHEPPALPETDAAMDPMTLVRSRVFRACLARRRGEQDWERYERDAFRFLADLIVHPAEAQPADPVRNILDDQIIWGRSPLRMDLAGGWSDTPPYCLELGGSVVNVAVDLNGQPPIQVFARISERPELVLRSIDQGVEERITTYEQLDTFRDLKGVFSIPKAALAIAGFLPRFNACRRHDTLQELLNDFGGGIELSMLAAVPKGSGLGTSSILSATVLGVLGELCALGWDRHDIFRQTLRVEQMLTSGGGWQDQAGGLFPGVKMIETEPGMAQAATIRWVSDMLFSGETAEPPALLYYTGITRTAHNILKEIVRGIFLNKREHLDVIGRIRENAYFALNAIQRSHPRELCEAVRRSWALNRELDDGTNPPAVQAIVARVQDYMAACKLLGAGGGGYMLILAKDIEAAGRIRETLRENPINPTARFVEFKVSHAGLQITRS